MADKFPDVELPEHHDPKTCPTCAPIIARRAYQRGVEAAKRPMKELPAR